MLAKEPLNAYDQLSDLKEVYERAADYISVYISVWTL